MHASDEAGVALEELFDALEAAVAQAGDPTVDEAERLVAVNAGGEAIAALWPIAEEQQRAHVLELLAFLDGAVGGLADRTDAAEPGGLNDVQSVVGLARLAITGPPDPEIIEHLLAAVTSDVWEMPMEASAAVLWRDLTSDADQTDGEARVDIPEPVVEAAEGDDASEQLGEVALEMLGLLAAGVEATTSELDGAVRTLSDVIEARQRVAALAEYADALSRLGEAAMTIELNGVQQICRILGDNLATWPPEDSLPPSLLEQLESLPSRFAAYLASPLSSEARAGIVDLVTHPALPAGLPPADGAELLDALRREPLQIEPDEDKRPLEVSDEDLDLTPAGDVDDAVVSGFKREGARLASQLAEAIQDLSDHPEPLVRLREAQRFAHTLKGSAGTCGIRAVTVLGHHLEDILEFLVEQERAPGETLAALLLEAADTLETMFEALNGREHPKQEEFRSVIQSVLDWANRIDRADEDEIAELTRLPASSPALAAVTVEQTVGGEAEAEAEPAAAARPGPAPEGSLQISTAKVDELLRLVGELSISLSQAEEQLRQSQKTLAEMIDQDRSNILHVQELETLVDVRGIGIREGRPSVEGGPSDPLELEEYNEMYITTRRIHEGVQDTREFSQTLNDSLAELENLNLRQGHLNKEIQQLVMESRLVPLSSAASRLQRVVRQTCRTTGKEADLVIKGAELQIDNELLDQLLPALMHVLRNSIDHGIEAPDDRERAGKSRRGRIELSFQQRGNQIYLHLADDGRGMDFERVRRRAVESGLIGADVPIDSRELARLTLKPGFTTTDRVTHISGRGVGMDVVDSTVRALKGNLGIESEPGRGYRLDIRLPTSLLTVYCLLVGVRGQTFAIPANEVEMAVPALEGSIAEEAGGAVFNYHERAYPLARLHDLLGLPGDANVAEDKVVLLTRSDDVTRALVVESLFDSRELVTKKLGNYVPKAPGVVAATILGDGRVAQILELHILYRIDRQDVDTVRRITAPAVAARARIATILIVDDSLSMRRALSQLVTDAGYRALTARDGMHAIRVAQEEHPDLLLVDLEMPQMNGLELTAHLRGQPETSSTPIAVITSRSTKTHRDQAQQAGANRYFVKPYREDEVLDFIDSALAEQADASTTGEVSA